MMSSISTVSIAATGAAPAATIAAAAAAPAAAAAAPAAAIAAGATPTAARGTITAMMPEGICLAGPGERGQRHYCASEHLGKHRAHHAWTPPEFKGQMNGFLRFGGSGLPRTYQP